MRFTKKRIEQLKNSALLYKLQLNAQESFLINELIKNREYPVLYKFLKKSFYLPF